jgi:hypothetical protein
MLTRADLPLFPILDTDAYITRSGVWVYAGSAAGSWTIAKITAGPRADDAQLYFVRVRPAAGPLTVTTTGGDNFYYAGTTSSTLTIPPGQGAVIVPSSGGTWEVLFMQAPRYQAVKTSSAATLTLARDAAVYVNTGAAATWTLPALANNAGLTYKIKNRGTGAVTLQCAGADQLYDTAAQTSISIAAGATVTVVNDGSYWLSA